MTNKGGGGPKSPPLPPSLFSQTVYLAGHKCKHISAATSNDIYWDLTSIFRQHNCVI